MCVAISHGNVWSTLAMIVLRICILVCVHVLRFIYFIGEKCPSFQFHCFIITIKGGFFGFCFHIRLAVLQQVVRRYSFLSCYLLQWLRSADPADCQPNRLRTVIPVACQSAQMNSTVLPIVAFQVANAGWVSTIM